MKLKTINLLLVTSTLMLHGCCLPPKTQTLAVIDQPVIDNEIAINEVPLEQTQEATNYYFDFDKARLQSADRPGLSGIAQYLAKNTDKVARIEGHADIRGTESHNDQLAFERAKEIAIYLKEHGVSDSQLKIVSKGASEPLDSSNNNYAYAKNRRATLYIDASENA